MQELLAQLQRSQHVPWLRPLRATLATASQALARTLPYDGMPINEIAITLDSRRIVGIAWDGELVIWDLSSSGMLTRLPGHAQSVTAFAISPDGRQAVGAEGTTLNVWDLRGFVEVRALTDQPGTVQAVAASLWRQTAAMS